MRKYFSYFIVYLVYCIFTFIISKGADNLFTFDHVFGTESNQSTIYNECVNELVNSAFEGFNVTILAYGQTGSGKTWTMGSSANFIHDENYDFQNKDNKNCIHESVGILPRVIQNVFSIVHQKELGNVNSSYKIHVQFWRFTGKKFMICWTRPRHQR